MTLFKPLTCLLLSLLLFACTDSTQKETLPLLAPPQFDRIDDPKAFLSQYFEDVSADRYLPAELQQMLDERTRMTFTEPLFKRHNPSALLEWYYADAYLKMIRERIDPDLAKMDYQLEVMGIDKAMAARIMVFAEAGPVQHKHQLATGELKQSWKQLDENRYEVRLTRGGWAQLIGVGRENGVWKLRVLVDG